MLAIGLFLSLFGGILLYLISPQLSLTSLVAFSHLPVLAVVAVASAVVGLIILVYATRRTQDFPGGVNWAFVYSEVKAFFQSGVFYILLGCLFLVAAWVALRDTHSVFVFLLAILGVAILLFGTGTQAAGDATTGNMKIAMAGGAGVLAAVFGFGVISYNSEIPRVFKRTVDYGILQFSNGSGTKATTNFDKFIVSAEMPGGRLLHLWKSSHLIHIMVPIFPEETNQSKVTLSINPIVQSPEWEPFEREYDDLWKETAREYFNNELMLVDRRDLKLITSKLPVSSQDDSKLSTRPEDQNRSAVNPLIWTIRPQ